MIGVLALRCKVMPKVPMSAREPQGESRSKPLKLDSTLSKGLLILECLAQSQGGMGVTDLAKALDLTKSNTFRLLQTLVALGYVRQAPKKTYTATLKTWQVGRALLDNLNLRDLAAPEMKSLSQETGEVVYLAVVEGLALVYIDKLDSSKPIQTWTPIGGSVPLHCTGTGKAVLAQNYERLRAQLGGQLTRFTDATLTTMRDVDRDVAETQRRGYAVDYGEYRDRVLSIGAAIALPSGEAIAAIGVSLPDVNMPAEGTDWLGGLVLRAARSVSAKLVPR